MVAILSGCTIHNQMLNIFASEAYQIIYVQGKPKSFCLLLHLQIQL